MKFYQFILLLLASYFVAPSAFSQKQLKFDVKIKAGFAVESLGNDEVTAIGSGKDITIKELAETIQNVIGHKGKIIWDASKPDGTPRKLMDVSKMKKLGWEYTTELELGIEKTYQWFLKNIDTFKEIKL